MMVAECSLCLYVTEIVPSHFLSEIAVKFLRLKSCWIAIVNKYLIKIQSLRGFRLLSHLTLVGVSHFNNHFNSFKILSLIAHCNA